MQAYCVRYAFMNQSRQDPGRIHLSGSIRSDSALTTLVSATESSPAVLDLDNHRHTTSARFESHSTLTTTRGPPELSNNNTSNEYLTHEPQPELMLRSLAQTSPRIVTPRATASRISLVSQHLFANQRLPTSRSGIINRKISNMASTSQQEHAALMIPGPIEFDDAVLNSMSHFRSVGSHIPQGIVWGVGLLTASLDGSVSTARVTLDLVLSPSLARRFRC